jgi:3-methyladenine DNA glycosylase AlkD
MGFQKQVVMGLRELSMPHVDKKRAEGAEKYLKGIAPFMGIDAPLRRSIGRELFASLPDPTSFQIGQTARALWRAEEREYQYFACDLIAYFFDFTERSFLADHVEFLITKKSWWDTVDSLGTVAVSPLTVRYPLKSLMNKWNRSENMWLNRAAIQHQRGRGIETDIPLLLKYCHDHAKDHRFFIAKAIGWALRDLSKFDKRSVHLFLKEHPDLDHVAVREARRYA